MDAVGRGGRRQGHAVPPLRRPRRPRPRAADERERELPGALIRGPPPLGPGAPPHERLVAFGRAYLEFLEAQGALLREAEGSHDAFLHSEVYAFYRMHVTLLLREAGMGERADFFADVVMFPLAATAHRYFRGLRALSCDQLADAHADLCTRLLTSSR